MPQIAIIREKISREGLRPYMLNEEMLKAVVDCEEKIMAVGGQLHADEEQMLLANGSKQQDLWGINLYIDDSTDNWIEFDSMINIRPAQGNRSRSIEDPELQKLIRNTISIIVP